MWNMGLSTLKSESRILHHNKLSAIDFSAKGSLKTTACFLHTRKLKLKIEFSELNFNVAKQYKYTMFNNG